MSLGDFVPGQTLYLKFTTYNLSTGLPIQLAGSPVISVYKDNSTTQSTAGITLTVDFDGVTGLNHITCDTSADGTFYSAASFFEFVITTGTLGGSSIAGAKVGNFTITATSGLRPTTAARTLDVTATGAAGIDWGNVENPSTANNLSATNIDVDQVVASVSGAVGSVAGTINGLTAAALADFFTVDSGETFASAIAGSVVYEIANNAGGGGDQWLTLLPGAYTAGMAGYIVGTNLNATISSVNDNINGVQQATIIKNSTGIVQFPMYVSGTQDDPAIGATVTAQRSDGLGGFASADGTVTEIGLGDYAFSYAAADSNIDSGAWIFSATGCKNTLYPFITSE